VFFWAHPLSTPCPRRYATTPPVSRRRRTSGVSLFTHSLLLYRREARRIRIGRFVQKDFCRVRAVNPQGKAANHLRNPATKSSESFVCRLP
jgi:hypothetical protein